MTKIKVIIVEDEFVISEDIRIRLELSGYEVMAKYERAEEALPAVLEKQPDILLVDIKLAGSMDGISLVKNVQNTMSIPIVYITANSDSATYARARDTRPHAFLVKPFSLPNLLTAVDLALHHFTNNTTPENIERTTAREYSDEPFHVNGSLFVRAGGKYKKISCDDILFVEAAGSYIHIQTRQERYTLSQNLSHFQNKTPLPGLIRTHRSYIVNLAHVDSFEDSTIYIKDHQLPLSDSFKADFMKNVRLV